MIEDQYFYANLKPFDHFRGVFSSAHYAKLPPAWSVVITDIEGSTKAIQQGKYRQVNAVGVASIVAVCNALKPLPIPFVFGGDGASLCIPNKYVEAVKKALVATKLMAREQFSLSLRVGIVPCVDIHQSQYQVLVAKCQISQGYYQAAFSGRGLLYAEQLVKNDRDNRYCFNAENISPFADFSGFECRWKDVPSPHGETISLLVMAMEENCETNIALYQDVFDVIQMIYGQVKTCRPVQKYNVELTTNSKNLQDEVKIRVGSAKRLSKWLYSWLLPWKVQLGRYWMENEQRLFGVDWGKYKDVLIDNTDFRKFDDHLRMVISGTTEQRHQLLEYLEKQYHKGFLVYGLHVSDRALMTCVISDYQVHHIHFVDGSDGGYAMAAKDLKKQLQETRSSN